MPKILTFSAQDYLKVIYDLTTSGTAASTNAIAGRLGVSPPSVTGMIQKLAEARPALVVYRKHRGAVLTAAGKRRALEIIRHHRLLETWLVRSLGYSWDRVHGEAEELEHTLSDEMERRIAAALGNPKRDPHGDPIPTADLIMPTDETIPLSNAHAGQETVVRRVDSREPRLLRQLAELGVVPETKLKVLAVSRAERIVHLKVGSAKRLTTLDLSAAGRVFVEKK